MFWCECVQYIFKNKLKISVYRYIIIIQYFFFQIFYQESYNIYYYAFMFKYVYGIAYEHDFPKKDFRELSDYKKKVKWFIYHADL